MCPRMCAHLRHLVNTIELVLPSAQSHIYIQKLPLLGHSTGRNSYWLANAARLLEAILTPEQRMISYQYCTTGHLFRTHRARPVYTCTGLLSIHTARAHGRGYAHVHSCQYGP